MTLPLTITDKITNGLSLLKSWKKNYMALPMTITDEITKEINPSESSRELRKNYMPFPLIITDRITNGLKIHLRI